MTKQYTVIIPAAGKGTRFLPFSALVPKEMVPIMQYPAIEYIAQECEKSGILHAVLIINKSKQMIIEYLKNVRQSKTLSTIDSVFQQEALGLGHAVLQAKEHIFGNFVAIGLPDDIIFSKKPVLQMLCDIAETYDASVVAIKQVPEQNISSYGVIAIKQKIEPGVFSVASVVEKPTQHNAPSCYAIIGRYVLQRDIFDALAVITPGAKGEYQLTDGINLLLQQNKRVLAVLFDGDHFDIGTPEGWSKAVAYCARGNHSVSNKDFSQ